MVIDIGSVSREIGELLWKSKNAQKDENWDDCKEAVDVYHFDSHE